MMQVNFLPVNSFHPVFWQKFSFILEQTSTCCPELTRLMAGAPLHSDQVGTTKQQVVGIQKCKVDQNGKYH